MGKKIKKYHKQLSKKIFEKEDGDFRKLEREKQLGGFEKDTKQTKVNQLVEKDLKINFEKIRSYKRF